jgi:hypothetical protein
MDGFDAQDVLTKWPLSSGGYSGFGYDMEYQPGRFGTGSMVGVRNGYNFAYLKRTFVASSEIIIGFAMNTKNSTTAFLVFLGDNANTAHLSIQNNANGVVTILRGSTVIATSSTNAYVMNTTQYYEIKASIDPTAGSVTVKIDGTQVLTFTGNTKNGGTNNTIDGVQVQNTANPYTYFDDLYILNTTGTTNNTFLGDVRVAALMPTGAGSSTQLTPTGSASNWQNTADVPINTARYNSSSTVGQRDTYALADLPAGTGTIFGIQTNMTASKSDAAVAGIKAAIKSGSNVYYDSTQNLSASAVQSRAVRETDPATSTTWTVSGINGLEAGAEVA